MAKISQLFKTVVEIPKETVYYYSKILSITLSNVALFGLIAVISVFYFTIDQEKIENLITAADKTQGSIKRLADYHAVLARTTATTMKSANETMKSANELLLTTSKLIDKDIPNTLLALREEARNTSLISKSAIAAIDSINTTILGVNNELPTLIAEIRTQTKDIGTKADTTLVSANLTILELKDAIAETKTQIKQNGDAATELLKNGNTLITSEGQVTKILAELQGSLHGINVITNDANLPNLINNANIGMKNLGDITYNANLVTQEGARLSKYFTDKIIGTPPKNWVDKYIWRPTIAVVKTLGAAGQFVYLLQMAK